jgi:hypothetical protein
MTGILSWPNKSEQFEPGWFIGSEGDNGEHIRDTSGWPYSVYRKTRAIGGCDVVLAHGIQSLSDAEGLRDMLNKEAKAHD